MTPALVKVVKSLRNAAAEIRNKSIIQWLELHFRVEVDNAYRR